MSALRIMVVEDETLYVKYIRRCLDYLGHTIVGTVSTGEEAVALAAEVRPDLILMDIVLKGAMDGIEAADRIREEFPIPIVYVTSYDTEDFLHRAKITEPFGYIIKPFSDRDINAVMEIAVYRNRMEAERAALSNDLKEALDQVKTLAGLLPICSSCKKIRDDKGYWKQIEEYISAHSSARFTHSFCPDCLKTFVEKGEG